MEGKSGLLPFVKLESSARTLTCRDTHWLNTVKVRRELVEKELGASKLDQRARQYFILGTSLAMLFDITVAGDFLRALSRLLDDWDYYCEKGGKAMVRHYLNRAPRSS
jgi:hypothetical protein